MSGDKVRDVLFLRAQLSGHIEHCDTDSTSDTTEMACEQTERLTRLPLRHLLHLRPSLIRAVKVETVLITPAIGRVRSLVCSFIRSFFDASCDFS